MKTDTFIEECRREWKRLGVAETVADEMAAELSADLAEAAADDVPAEELLGSGAHDARGFAAQWASERGVVPSRPERRVGLLAGVAIVLAAVAIAAGLLSTRSTSPRTQPPTANVLPRKVVVVNPVTGQATAQLVLRLEKIQYHRAP